MFIFFLIYAINQSPSVFIERKRRIQRRERIVVNEGKKKERKRKGPKGVLSSPTPTKWHYSEAV
jgi:hypothetical protein